MMPEYWTTEAASGWGGDRFFVIAERPGAPREGNRPDDGFEYRGPRGIWVTAWDTERDRQEFIRGYEEERKLPGRTVVNVGRRAAVFLFGVDDEARKALERALQDGALVFARDGKPWDVAAAGP
jgi:hypothetical protein